MIKVEFDKNDSDFEQFNMIDKNDITENTTDIERE